MEMERITVCRRQGRSGPETVMEAYIEKSRHFPGFWVGWMRITIGKDKPYHRLVMDQVATQAQALQLVKAELVTHVLRGTVPPRSVHSQPHKRNRTPPPIDPYDPSRADKWGYTDAEINRVIPGLQAQPGEEEGVCRS